MRLRRDRRSDDLVLLTVEPREKEFNEQMHRRHSAESTPSRVSGIFGHFGHRNVGIECGPGTVAPALPASRVRRLGRCSHQGSRKTYELRFVPTPTGDDVSDVSVLVEDKSLELVPIDDSRCAEIHSEPEIVTQR